MFEEQLALPAEPLLLARRLAQRPYLSLFWSKNGSSAYLTCDPVEHSHALDPEPELLLSARTPAHAVPRWVGLLPYECRRGLERVQRVESRAAPHSI